MISSRSALQLTALLTCGCAGSMPLLHPAHTLPAGSVTMGAGVAGHVAALDAAQVAGDDKSEPVLEDYAIAPGVAPWAAARIGIEGSNEAGLTYAGRAFRLDVRHAFEVGPLFLSLELGASALIPRPRGGTGADDLGSAYGVGGDVPILLGWVSDAELYSVWFGPRGGFEYLKGDVIESEILTGGSDDTFLPFEGKHGSVGGLLGMKVGFRTFHVGIELDVAYHFVDGTFGENPVRQSSFGQLTVSPGGALLLTL